jgi:hypothetical protein
VLATRVLQRTAETFKSDAWVVGRTTMQEFSSRKPHKLHVIEVLTEKVSTAYLKHLQDKQVSFIFAGKKEIDLKVALQKLDKLFGIKKSSD